MRTSNDHLAGLFGLGCMVAPYMTVVANIRAWDLLALIDILTAFLLLKNRLVVGKPRNWKEKIRSSGEGPSSNCSSAQNSLPGSPVISVVPSRVLRAGIAFVFVVEATETALSSWCFTYAVTVLKLPSKIAALLPTTFYTTFTCMRVILIPLSTKVAPSTLVHIGTMVVVTSVVAFFILTAQFNAALVQETRDEELFRQVIPLLVCLACYGAGSCPLYSMMLASLRQHGQLTARQAGLYDTACNLGIATGLWAPGLISMPSFELLGGLALWLIASSNSHRLPKSEVH